MASIIICPKCGSRETVSDDGFFAAARCSSCGRSFADSRDSTSTSGSFSGHQTFVDKDEEPLVDWDRAWRRMGTFLSVLAIGSFILPLFGLQFRFLQLLGPAQYLLAIVFGIIGAVLIAIGLRKNPLLATAAACSVVMLMVVSCVIALLGSVEWENKVAQPPQQHRAAPQQAPLHQPNGELPSEPEYAVAPQRPAPPLEPPRKVDGPIPELAPVTPDEPVHSTPPSIVPPPLEPLVDGEPQVSQVATRTNSLDEPGFDLPAINYGDDDLFSTGVSGSDRGEHSGERAPEGGVIVGFRIIQGTNWGGAIQGIQPIFQVGSRYVEGEVHGTPGGVKQHLVLAKPGYAVGKIGLRSGLVVSALRISFYRIIEERLDPGDTLATDWIGCDGGSERKSLDGHGEFLVGITAHFQKDLLGLEAVRGLRLGAPDEPLPIFSGRVVTSAFPKRRGVTAFRDFGPEGAVLVGLRLGKGQSWGGAIQNIQPIYQLEDEYVLGEIRGKPGADVHQAVAKAGYAVGAIQVRRGLVLNAVRLIYCRVEGEQLDINDRYATGWIGCDGGGPELLDGHGHLFAGIVGEFGNDIHQLGIATLE